MLQFTNATPQLIKYGIPTIVFGTCMVALLTLATLVVVSDPGDDVGFRG